MPIYKAIDALSNESHTKSFWDYCEQTELQIRIIYFLARLSQMQDKGRLIAKLTLRKINETVADSEAVQYGSIEDIQKEVLTKGPATKEFIKLYEDLSRNMYVRNIENFETFLSDLLAKIYLQKPDMLRGKETITLDEVLQFDNREELVKYLAEKRIINLQMQGLSAVGKYVREKHGLEWFDPEIEKVLNNINAIRNLIVHNKSCYNYHYLRRHPNSAFSEGDEIMTKKFADEYIVTVLNIASRVDTLTAEQFKFPLMTIGEFKKLSARETE